MFAKKTVKWYNNQIVNFEEEGSRYVHRIITVCHLGKENAGGVGHCAGDRKDFAQDLEKF